MTDPHPTWKRPLRWIMFDNARVRVPVVVRSMSAKWRAQCHYTPYGVSDDIFTDKVRLIAFVTERLGMENLARMQIDRQRGGRQ